MLRTVAVVDVWLEFALWIFRNGLTIRSQYNSHSIFSEEFPRYIRGHPPLHFARVGLESLYIPEQIALLGIPQIHCPPQFLPVQHLRRCYYLLRHLSRAWVVSWATSQSWITSNRFVQLEERGVGAEGKNTITRLNSTQIRYIHKGVTWDFSDSFWTDWPSDGDWQRNCRPDLIISAIRSEYCEKLVLNFVKTGFGNRNFIEPLFPSSRSTFSIDRRRLFENLDFY